jgi:hypothetical protein
VGAPVIDNLIDLASEIFLAGKKSRSWNAGPVVEIQFFPFSGFPGFGENKSDLARG